MSAARIDLINSTTIQGTRANLAIDIRTDWLQLFVHKDAAGDPTNIAGWTFACEIRNTAGTLIATPTGAIVTAVAGIYSLALDVAVTSALAVGVYNYDVLVTISGEISKLQYGQIQVSDTVTNV